VGFNFAPVDWALCNGAIMAISNNPTLFQLIGTTYGGDGQNTFALPNLQSRIPIHEGTDPAGNNYVIGQLSGSETQTLTLNQTPSHTHTVAAAATTGTSPNPQNAVWAESAMDQFSAATPVDSMGAAALASIGGSQPHNNMPPFVAVNFIISLFGVFPSQN
jgi:microcystin-dependent protein